MLFRCFVTVVYWTPMVQKILWSSASLVPGVPDLRGLTCISPPPTPLLCLPTLNTGNYTIFYIYLSLLQWTLLRLCSATRVSYRYHLSLSPLDGVLYISDPESHQIIRVRNTEDYSDPDHNWETAVGSGERCLPGDEAHCGDGALARDAKLAYPKGLQCVWLISDSLEVAWSLNRLCDYFVLLALQE
jgi:hypothetical protein